MTVKSTVDYRANQNPIHRLFMILALTTLILGTHSANGQVLYGALTGTLTDRSGAVVPNTEVVITNESTGAVRTANADQQGDYSFKNVLPGPYTVSVTPKGNFARFTQKSVQVDTNRTMRVDVILQVGNVSQEITDRKSVV